MTDKMIIAGATRLAELAPALRDPNESLLPPFGHAPDVNFDVALAVLEAAVEEGVAKIDVNKDDWRKYAESQRWDPEYAEYVYDPKGFK